MKADLGPADGGAATLRFDLGGEAQMDCLLWSELGSCYAVATLDMAPY
jgi:hypothetical protein